LNFHQEPSLKFIFTTYYCQLPWRDFTAKELSGISFVTTDPAPITQPLPIVILGHITELPPIQQSSPIVMGKALSSVLHQLEWMRSGI
jgi:hypothetical protein